MDGLLKTHHYGSGDNAVPDVQFFHPADSADGLHIAVIEAVAQVNVQPLFAGKGGGFLQSRELGPSCLGCAGFGIPCGLDLHRPRS